MNTNKHAIEQNSRFVVADDQCTPNQLTRANYAAIDRERETGKVTDIAPKSFFLLAFARPNEMPLSFNFDLCLLDTLTLS